MLTSDPAHLVAFGMSVYLVNISVFCVYRTVNKLSEKVVNNLNINKMITCPENNKLIYTTTY